MSDETATSSNLSDAGAHLHSKNDPGRGQDLPTMPDPLHDPESGEHLPTMPDPVHDPERGQRLPADPDPWKQPAKIDDPERRDNEDEDESDEIEQIA
jgi:hypothetical protein